MATFSNNFYGGGKGYNICLDITTNSQNIANNTSNVTVSVRLQSLGSSYTIVSSTTKNGSVTINGTKYTFTFTAGLSGSQNKTLFTKTVDVPHNSDGTKTLSASATCYLGVTLSGTFYGNVSVSGSTLLTAIPRTTPISMNSTGTFGSTITISHKRAASSLTVTVRYTCGSTSGWLVQKAASDSTSWTIPKTLQNQIPKATSIRISVYCDTYSGNTLIGTTSTSFTCNIASDCVPVISSGKFTNGNTGTSTYYQSVSQVRAEINCSGAYGSTITKYVMTIENNPVTNYGNIIWSKVLTGSGTKDIALTITDSRGKTASYTWKSAIQVTPYAKPQITTLTCKRTGINETGAEVISNLGTIGYVTAKGSFHSTATTKNRKILYKPTTSTTWTTINISNADVTDYKFSSALASGSAYDIKFVMEDNISSSETQIKMQNLYPLINMNAAGNGIAFGKECTIDNRFTVDMDARFNKWCGITHLEVTGSSLFQGSTAQFEVPAIFKYNSSGFNTTINGGSIYFGNFQAILAGNSDLYINGNRNWANVYVNGSLTVRDRGDNLAIFRIQTAGDGNPDGDGNTMLGYYQSNLGGYGHYFRGLGQFTIDNRYGLMVNKGNMCLSGSGWLMADKMSYTTSGGWVNSSGTQTWGVGCSNHFLPTETTRYLGTAAHRWQQLYCVSSPSVSSDARNKENVKYMYDEPEVICEYTDVKENDEITTHDLLDFVLNDLHMVTFDYKQSIEDMEEGEIEMVTAMNNRQIGFIAQDIENTKVGRYLITKDSEGALSYESANWPSIIAGALQQEIRDRQMADKELLEILKDIINE